MTPAEPARHPVLLVHPWGSTGQTTWGPVATALGDRGVETVTIDLPGHGSKGAVEFNWQSGIDSVRVAVDDLGDRPVIIVGLSLGAAVALHASKAMPAAVHGVVLSGAALSFRPLGVRAALQGVGRLAALFGSVGVWGPLAKAAGYTDSDEVRLAAAQISHGSPRQLVRAADALAHFDATGWNLAAIRAQVIVFNRDKRMPPRLQRDLARQLAVAPIEISGDHDAPVREPQKMVSALMQAFTVLA